MPVEVREPSPQSEPTMDVDHTFAIPAIPPRLPVPNLADQREEPGEAASSTEGLKEIMDLFHNVYGYDALSAQPVGLQEGKVAII